MNKAQVFKAADYINVCRFSSNEETRYYLNGVFVDTLNKRLVATDGHRLGMLALDAEDMRSDPAMPSFILTNSKDLQRACKASRYETVWLRCFVDRLEVIKVTATGDAAEIAAYVGTVDYTFPAARVYVDGTFPDYDRVIPREVTGQVCEPITDRAGAVTGMRAHGVNAAYLATFVDPDSKTKWVEYLPSGGSPGLVFTSDKRFLGVLIPTRVGTTPDDAAARVKTMLKAR